MENKLDTIYQQILSLCDKGLPLISNLSNVSSILNQLEDINWCGFYLVEDDHLILGPFQGEPACTIIPYGKGVCGTSFKEKKTIIVEDVNKFSGHIACSSKSKSEIVTPVIKEGKVVAVIDVDAPIFDRFHQEEKELLEKVADYLSTLF